MAQAIWYTFDSDRQQINMLKAAVSSSSAVWMNKHKTAKKDLTWLLTKSENLADSRNNLVHGPTAFILDDHGIAVSGDPESGHKRAKALLDKDLNDEVSYCVGRATALEDYSMNLLVCIQTQQIALPSRPLLPEKKQKNDRTK